ncbi:spermidine synthase [Bizionia sp. KMM 8389]
MAKLLSYIYPITKKVTSDINGILEITWYNGKKHLNSKNANYSYGSLQRILKFGLEQINLKNTHNILLLGLGGGSVIETLQKDYNYTKTITAVDIDPQIIAVANSEFGIKTSENLNIVCDDAFQFLNKTTDTFDLIIIDLFIDTTVPDKFLKLDFWESIIKKKTPNGTILFNASLETDISEKLKHIISYLKSHMFEVVVFEKVNQTNTVIIGKPL